MSGKEYKVISTL